MRKIQFIGISDGKVGSSKCGECEHCDALPRGISYFDLDGVTFCESCILSSDYKEDEVKLVKKDKKWHVFPNADKNLTNFTFGTKNIRLIQTFKVDLKKEISNPDKFKLALYDSKNQIKSFRIFEMQDLVSEFINFLLDNSITFTEEQFKEENQQHFEFAYCSSEPHYKSYKNQYLNELMDIFEDYCFHNEKYQEEIKQIYTQTMEEFSQGRKKILEDKILVPFLEYHFEKISKGWPDFIKKDFKKWNIFKNKNQAIAVDLKKYQLMWGTYLSNGECDLDFRWDYDGDYEWEDEVKYLDNYFERDENQYNQCKDFFEKINVSVKKENDQLIFKLLKTN